MFRCALAELEEVSFSVTTFGSSTVVQLPVGYNEETGLRYSIAAAFDAVPGYGTDVRELAFWMTEYDPDEDVVYDLRDSLAIKEKIPAQSDRLAILDALRQMVGVLIDEAAPRVVTMIPQEANLPPRAMRRYRAVAAVFADRGYRVGTSDPYHGRQTWMMERTA